MKKVVVRADGNAATGLGHLYRAAAVVEMLGADNCVVATRADSVTEGVFHKVQVTSIAVQKIEEEIQELITTFPPSRHLMVIDGYHFTSDYQGLVKEAGYTLVVIDDLANGHFFADAVINHSPLATAADYDAEPYTRFAFGTGYAMVRKAFLNAAGRQRHLPASNDLFLCFGGADPMNFTGKLIGMLYESALFSHIHAVTGAANAGARLLERNGVTVHRNLPADELVQLVSSCRFAIVPASTVLFEVCCVKMPVLTGYYAINQQKAYEGFARAKAVIGAGDLRTLADTDWKDYFHHLHSADASPLIAAQSVLFDGRQAMRLKDFICQL